MNIPQSIPVDTGVASDLDVGSGESRRPEPAPSPAWRTQDRISRCRGLGYCVIEVHEFDPERPHARPAIEYRVYREARGFPVGAAIGSFPSRDAAQCRAERLGATSPGEQS